MRLPNPDLDESGNSEFAVHSAQAGSRDPARHLRVRFLAAFRALREFPPHLPDRRITPVRIGRRLTAICESPSTH